MKVRHDKRGLSLPFTVGCFSLLTDIKSFDTCTNPVDIIIFIQYHDVYAQLCKWYCFIYYAQQSKCA